MKKLINKIEQHRNVYPNYKTKLTKLNTRLQKFLTLYFSSTLSHSHSQILGKAKFRLQLKDFGGKTEMFHVCMRHKNWRHSQFRFLISYGEISK